MSRNKGLLSSAKKLLLKDTSKSSSPHEPVYENVLIRLRLLYFYGLRQFFEIPLKVAQHFKILSVKWSR